MSFNVSGQEVASGVQDPTTMFSIVIAVLFVGLLVAGVVYLYNTWGK